ncbi:unnamed protein product [Owenia fusiformis]|uniref:Sodium-coupled monocarboxylate transporter 1 n=1 Tax=Owenia fusiformis TaxID=6347 RepID=A0A8S4P591_OWEFU|nr:unnamed protein product [Owenia fusiformis]
MGLEEVTLFGIADYVIFAIFILASLGIGVYYALSGGRQQTTKEYLTADKQLKIIPTALSLLVSFQSAIMILGYPAEMYMRGAQIYVGNIGLLIGTILTTRLWVPLFYKLKITSTFEYLHLRFDSVAVRKLGSAIGIVSTGGLKAVIWTDVFQSVIMLGGILTVVVMILPYFVMDTFRSLPGFPGLFLATLFSGALSSISSGLNALSAITWEDFLKHRFRHLKESRKALCTKLLVLFYGVCSTGIACLAIFIKGPIIQANATLGGAINGSSCAIFILAAFTVTSNWKGALVGPMVSFPIILWIAIGGQSIKGHNQYLPPGPTDRCDISNGSSIYNSSGYSNVTTWYDDTIHTTSMLNHSSISNSELKDQELSGIQHLYSISYFLYTPFGILIATVVGLVVSWATGGEKKRPIDKLYTFQFCDALCCCCPPSVKNSRRGCRDNQGQENGSMGVERDVFRDTKFQHIQPTSEESKC